MKNGLIGKAVILKDWKGRQSDEWGIVKDYDGQNYWISFGDDRVPVPYCRGEFIVPRDNVKREFRKCSNQK